MSYQNKKSLQYGIGFLSMALMYAQHAHAQTYTYYQASRIEISYLLEAADERTFADISNSGAVAVATGTGAFIYKNGITTRINVADNYYTTNIHINNNDQVAGIAVDTSSYKSINYFYDNGSIQDIGSIYPIKINDNGQIIGQQGSGVVSYLNGTAAELALPYRVATVNSANNAAGTDSNGKLFTYINGEKQIINYPAGVNFGIISAINDNNKAVGQLLGDGRQEAFLLDNDTITTLGKLGTREASYANDINESGTIVGKAYDFPLYSDDYFSWESTRPRNNAAFIKNDGAMTNLNSLLTRQDLEKGVTLTSALAINDFDFIVARGYETGHGEAIYLLTPTPVPLPASVWMFLSGLSFFGALRRLSRKV